MAVAAAQPAATASKLLYKLNRAFIPRQLWRETQRRFDVRAVYEASQYFQDWQRGSRYVPRPPFVRINAVTHDVNDIFLGQLIHQLTAYHTEVCKWKLGHSSLLTEEHDGLRKEKMPLAKIDSYRPVFCEEPPPVQQRAYCPDAMVESMSQSPRTFTLERRESPYSPPAIERGVYLRGRAVPGQLVAVYPGLMYPPNVQGKTLKTESSDVWMRLLAGGGNVVDAADHAILSLTGLPYHPLAFGHWINHPPEGVHPNVLKFTLVISSDFPRHLLPLIPIRWAARPGWVLAAATPTSKRAVMFAVIYVAARHLHDEELFAEVRMQPGTYPDWYTPYREERNCRSFGLSPPWSDERDPTRTHDGASVGSR